MATNVKKYKLGCGCLIVDIYGGTQALVIPISKITKLRLDEWVHIYTDDGTTTCTCVPGAQSADLIRDIFNQKETDIGKLRQELIILRQEVTELKYKLNASSSPQMDLLDINTQE